MSRVAITEFAAKRLLLGDTYGGITVTPDTQKEALQDAIEGKRYIVKIDVGIKKRGKQGLIRVDIPKEGLEKALSELFALGHARCLIEEMVPHETNQEAYISISLEREGSLVLHTLQGGVEIEENSQEIQRILIPRTEVLSGNPSLFLPSVPLPHLLCAMQEHHMSFLEINPYIVASNMDFIPLDMAVEIDSTKAHTLPAWVQEHILSQRISSPAEQKVQQQDAKTAAALSLKILNPNGSILTLFSGGGASLVAMDTLVASGLQDAIINYSEYSGAPTREETAQYVSTLLEVLFASNAPKKAVLIAGGVANFTDILTTFQGIVDACTLHKKELKAQHVYICARRGGPNQEKGLAYLRDFLASNDIPHDVYDPSLPLSDIGERITTHI